MGLVITNDHKAPLLAGVIPYLKTLKIHLFKNDHDPAPEDTSSDYVEADFPGYQSQYLLAWGKAYLDNDNRGAVDHPNVYFSATGTTPENTIYGYWVADQLGEVVWAERNPEGPVTIGAPGNTYIVGPRFQGFQC